MKKRIVLPLLLLLFTSPLFAVTKVACIGDSITYGLKIWDRTQNNYPAQLALLLGDEYQVVNFSVSGVTAQKSGNKPYTNRPEYRKSLEFMPDVILLMLGTNDAKTNNWKGSASYRSAMEDLIASYKELASNPKIYLLKPPRSFKDSYTIKEENIRQELLVFPYLQGTTIDTHSFTYNHPEWFNSDGIHPNKDGSLALAFFIKSRCFDGVKSFSTL